MYVELYDLDEEDKLTSDNQNTNNENTDNQNVSKYSKYNKCIEHIKSPKFFNKVLVPLGIIICIIGLVFLIVGLLNSHLHYTKVTCYAESILIKNYTKHDKYGYSLYVIYTFGSLHNYTCSDYKKSDSDYDSLLLYGNETYPSGTVKNHCSFNRHKKKLRCDNKNISIFVTIGIYMISLTSMVGLLVTVIMAKNWSRKN